VHTALSGIDIVGKAFFVAFVFFGVLKSDFNGNIIFFARTIKNIRMSCRIIPY